MLTFNLQRIRDSGPCIVTRAVARTLIGGCIFIYSGYARLTSFEINCISKETGWAEPEYMNIPPPPPNERSSDGPDCNNSAKTQTMKNDNILFTYKQQMFT